MDRRVFQPRTDSRDERRRSAIGMSVLILIAGGLWLLFLRNHPAASRVPKDTRSIPVQSPR